MKKLFLIIFCSTFTFFVQAQNEQLAQNYFDRGEFEKAQIAYEDLLKAQPNNFNYFQKTVECYQQLSQFDKAEKAIQDRLDRYKQGNFLIELGLSLIHI
jgi:tetratricopeptide (TPR) repeat protein